jgi:hypothetical protein
MAGYLHVDLIATQRSKQALGPCGDVVRTERTARATTTVVADGIGSGIKAHVAATAAASRLFELLARGFSLRDAFAAVAHTNQQAMGTDLPFVAFSVARITPDGRATVLTFEAPPAILVGRRRCQVLSHRTLNLEQAVIYEANCQLESGEGLLLVSDGVTQAGLGRGLPLGWGVDEVARFVSGRLGAGLDRPRIAAAVLGEAAALWGRQPGDDCTVTLADCREGVVVTLLTGPPAARRQDGPVVRDFLQRPGRKAICGATTAKLVQRATGAALTVDEAATSVIAPPRYALASVDLATEGAVTLNHVFNIWDADEDGLEPGTGPTLLRKMLKEADRIDILCGGAPNLAGGDIAFRQQGIIGRRKIVALLAERMRADGKLVTLRHV